MAEELNKQETPVETAVTSSDKLMEIYDQITNEADETSRLASFLTTTNYYSYGLKVANELNGRQGKSRVTINDRSTRLMGYSLEVDVSEVTDNIYENLYLDILNAYLQDKQQLPSDKPRVAQGMLSRVKALFIMLVVTDKSWLIPKIDPIPNYMLKMTRNLFDHLQKIRDDALNSFIEYLKQSENFEMAEIVKATGNRFWGSEKTKPNVIYDHYFHQIQTSIKQPKKTYEMYLFFRQQYRNSTINILPSRIHKIFEITLDAYYTARQNVWNEIRELFPQSEYAKSIKSLLLYEQQ